MNSLVNKTLVALATSGLLAGLYAVDTPLASARGTAGSSGEVWFGAQSSCMERFHGFLRNTCSVRVSVTLPATYDNAGGMRFQISTRGRVACRAFSRDPWSGGLRAGDFVVNDDPAGVSHLFTSVDAHGWGSAYAHCDLDPNAVIHNYHY